MVKSIKFITDTNHETVVDLLNPYGSKYLVVDIDGLGPVKASINGSKIAGNDGSVFNNAQIDTRNINISFKIADTINGQYKPIWKTRRECYVDFPVKRPLRIEFTREDDSVLWIKGYVESCDPEFFSAATMLTVSIICVDPFFREGETLVDEVTGVTPVSKIYGDYEYVTPTDTSKYPKTLTKYQAFDVSTGKLFPYLRLYYYGYAYFGGDFENEFEKPWTGTAAQCVYSYDLFPADWAATDKKFIYRSTQHQVGRCIMFDCGYYTIDEIKQFWKKRSPNYILTNCDEESPETTWHTVRQKSTGLPGYIRESDGLFVPVTQMQVESVVPGMHYETEYPAGVKIDMTITDVPFVPNVPNVPFKAKMNYSKWQTTSVWLTLYDKETGVVFDMSAVKAYFDSHTPGTWALEISTSLGTEPRQFVFGEMPSISSYNGWEITTGESGRCLSFHCSNNRLFYNSGGTRTLPTIPIDTASCGDITVKNNDSTFLIFEDRLQYIDDALTGFQTGDVIKIDTSVGKRSVELVRTEPIYGNEQHYNLISAIDRYSDWFAFVSDKNVLKILTETEGVGISFKIEVPHIRGGV